MYLVGNSTSVLVFHALLIITLVICDIFFSSDAFKNSNMLTIQLQAYFNSFFLDIFFIFFATLLTPYFLIPAFLLFYSICMDKQKTIRYFIFFGLCAYLLSISKVVYGSPRPYFVDRSVKAKECYAEYGNPSGHACFSFIFYGMIYQRYVWRKRLRNIEEERQEILLEDLHHEQFSPFGRKKSGTIFIIWNAVVFIFLSFTCLGRMYLGMHSYDQILFGIAVGFYAIFFYYIKIEDWIHELMKRIARCNQKHFPLHAFVIFVSAHLAFTITPVVMFILAERVDDAHNDWIDLIKESCKKLNPNDFLTRRCFLDCAIIQTSCGIVYGMFFTKGEFDQVQTNETQKLSLKQYVFRTIILMTIVAAPAVVFGVLPNGGNIYISYFFNYSLGIFFSGFAMIHVPPMVFKKLRLDAKGDFLRFCRGALKCNGEHIHQPLLDADSSHVTEHGSV